MSREKWIGSERKYKLNLNPQDLLMYYLFILFMKSWSWIISKLKFHYLKVIQPYLKLWYSVKFLQILFFLSEILLSVPTHLFLMSESVGKCSTDQRFIRKEITTYTIGPLTGNGRLIHTFSEMWNFQFQLILCDLLRTTTLPPE